tara:strand:- start:80401 stop:80964 length:564 start_codon:yes stop_codon:yes gene_type:complete
VDIDDTPVQSYFHEVVNKALSTVGLKLSHWSEFYIVDLLVRQASKAFDVNRPLVDLLMEVTSEPSPHRRFEVHQRLGDTALFLAGFCVGYIRNRGLSLEYIKSMGRRGYTGASEYPLSPTPREVFEELSQEFEGVALVYDEVREQTTVGTTADVVKLWEQYRKTKSPAVKRRLYLNGVILLDEDEEV